MSTWSENRINNKKANSFLTEISKDFRADSLSVNRGF